MSSFSMFNTETLIVFNKKRGQKTAFVKYFKRIILIDNLLIRQ